MYALRSVTRLTSRARPCRISFVEQKQTIESTHEDHYQVRLAGPPIPIWGVGRPPKLV